MNRYIYLDRDGVINVDGVGRTETGYVMKWENFEFAPGALEGMKMFGDAGYEIVVLSNQQCVGKGYCTEEELEALSEKMSEEIEAHGGKMAGVYCCPHLKTEGCECRKPKPGLFEEAMEDLGIENFESGFYVGDTERDIAAGKAAGLKTILILTGKAKKEDIENWTSIPDHVCANMVEVAELVIGGK